MAYKEIKFNAVAMEKLVQKDQYLLFVFQDLSKKGHTNKEDLLEMLFNSFVQDDSLYEHEYEKELNNIKH